MTIDGYKSCRILGNQVLSTKLNTRCMYTEYSSDIITVPVAWWLASSPLILISRVRSASGAILFFKKGHWNEPAIQSTEWWLKCDWNPPFPSPFSHHSVTIQSTERWDFILWPQKFYKNGILVDSLRFIQRQICTWLMYILLNIIEMRGLICSSSGLMEYTRFPFV